MKLIAQVGPTVQRTNELPAVESWKLANGDWVFDLGQNMVGVVRLKRSAASAGRRSSLKYGEMLNGKEDRSVYTDEPALGEGDRHLHPLGRR